MLLDKIMALGSINGKGYGYLPLTSLKSTQVSQIDTDPSASIQQNCGYIGNQVNLYNDGIISELEIMLKNLKDQNDSSTHVYNDTTVK